MYQGLLYHRLDSFFARRHKFGGFNGNVLVLKGGRVLYKGCFGYCNYTTKDTLDAQTAFQIASSSKPFTSTAILKLVDEGKLALSDSLGKFFPGFPYRGITVEMLLCHRTGLPNYLFFGQKYWKDRSVYMSNDALLDILMKNKNIEGTSRPGRQFQYNNTNFALLASIVEKVTGKRFPEYMKETFFVPLGMKNTWIRDVQNEKEERRHALSYNSVWKLQPEDPYDGVYGDKNVFSTTEDMMIWDRAFYEERNISKAWQAEAYKPRSFEQKGQRNYGYGWRLLKQPNGESVVFHNGWWHGNNTVFYRYMPDTFALIILSNRYNQGVYDVQPVFNIIGATKDTMPHHMDEEAQ
jgi:CubicO group peptidase (beta-lactamase class C family)